MAGARRARAIEQPDKSEDEDSPRLSSRQSEILSMLMAGHSNKDIAYELGIGLGTVKQHLVALFKKLHVTNRAMAISRGFAMNGRSSAAVPSALAMAATLEGVMELRPSNVLSLALDLPATHADADAAEIAWGALRKSCSAATASIDAALIGRPGAGIDIVFGLHKVYEDGALKARRVGIEVARMIRAELPSARLRGGLASGELSASMHRMGGWTGETVAGQVIGVARRLREQAGPGVLLVDGPSRRLLAFAHRAERGESGAQDAGPPVQAQSIAAEDDLPPPYAPPPIPRMIGRTVEMQELRDFLRRLERGLGSVVWIEGESGMGKTSLGHAFGAEGVNGGAAWIEARCGMPGRTPAEILLQSYPALDKGEGDFAVRAAAVLARATKRKRLIFMIDDIHLADAATVALIQRIAEAARKEPLLLLGVGRGLRQPALREIAASGGLRLLHLSTAEIEAVVAGIGRGVLTAPAIADIVRVAAGVPLFAAEMAREAVRAYRQGEPRATLPLTLEALVLSRLNSLPLDRSLLRLIAEGRGARRTRRQLGEEWEDDSESFDRAFEAAIKSGIVVMRGEGPSAQVGFGHPLVGAVLERVMLAPDPMTLRVAEASGAA